ncbi:ABC transporter permease [Gordonia sp. GN26]
MVATIANAGSPVKERLRSQTAIVWVLLLAAIPLSRLASENFPSWSLVDGTLVLSLFLVLVAFGQGLVILTGGIDLSLATIVTLGAYLTGRLASDGMPLPLAILLTLLGCAVVGVVNGLLVGKAGFPAFIVTLATGSIVAALLLGVSRGAPAQQSPSQLSSWFGNSSILGISTPIWMLLVVCLLGWAIQHRSVLGRRAFAVGGSPTAAKLSGIPVISTYVMTYAVAAIAYGLAGIALLGYSSGADLSIGNNWLLPSITAVVVGGSSIRGGAGAFIGTVGGAILITLLGTDISAAGLAEGWKQVLYGLIIIAALLGNRVFQSGRR